MLLHFGKDAIKSATEINERIAVPTKLKNIMSKWLAYKKKNGIEDPRIFPNLTKNLLGKNLQRIFTEHGLPALSVSMLRKIYVSDHPSNRVKQIVDSEMKDIAVKMNHSTGVQQTIYTKK